jgi:hemoglobin
MHDILTKDDVTLLITEFYKKVRQDPQISQHFARVDWDHHTPVIIDFWNMILLGDSAYKGNPFLKHINLPLQREDFDRWLLHFSKTVDEHFTGDKAEEAKQRAVSIAGMFQAKMGLY